MGGNTKIITKPKLTLRGLPTGVLLHMSDRFALLSKTPAEKHNALVIGDSTLRHLRAPSTLVRCVPGARMLDIAANELMIYIFFIQMLQRD